MHLTDTLIQSGIYSIQDTHLIRLWVPWESNPYLCIVGQCSIVCYRNASLFFFKSCWNNNIELLNCFSRDWRSGYCYTIATVVAKKNPNCTCFIIHQVKTASLIPYESNNTPLKNLSWVDPKAWFTFFALLCIIYFSFFSIRCDDCEVKG